MAEEIVRGDDFDDRERVAAEERNRELATGDEGFDENTAIELMQLRGSFVVRMSCERRRGRSSSPGFRA